jgi:hypothetical protein
VRHDARCPGVVSSKVLYGVARCHTVLCGVVRCRTALGPSVGPCVVQCLYGVGSAHDVRSAPPLWLVCFPRGFDFPRPNADGGLILSLIWVYSPLRLPPLIKLNKNCTQKPYPLAPKLELALANTNPNGTEARASGRSARARARCARVKK